MSVETLGPHLSRRIVSDASKIWFMFIDDQGDNQISVDHKSLITMLAAVWGPHPPTKVRASSAAPDLRKVAELVETVPDMVETCLHDNPEPMLTRLLRQYFPCPTPT